MTTQEEGLIHRIITNDVPRLIYQLKNNSIPRPIPIHPTRLSVHFPHGGQYTIYSPFLLLALVLVVALVPIQGKSQTRERKEKQRSNRPTKLASRLTKPASCRTRPYLRPSTPVPAHALHSSLQGHHSLQLQWTQQGCTSSDTATRLYLYRLPLQVPDPPSVPFQSR